jgi:acyl-CoA synthetase (AMP-forming)/AMP-acid ligase II
VRGLRDESRAMTMLDVLDVRSVEREFAPAILAPDCATLSYVELRARVYRAGEAFAALGLGPGARIATALRNGPDAAVAMLAAMCWTTAAPLDPDGDEALAATLLRHMRVDALIVHRGAASPTTRAADALGIPIVGLVPGAADPAAEFALRGDAGRAPIVPARPRPDDVAVVSHTSGTTAKPKIVPLTHGGLTWSRSRGWLGPSDRFLCVTPLHTSSGIGNGIVVPLKAGASTVLCPGFDPERFFDWLLGFRPTYFSASPTVHRAIIDECGRRRLRLPSSLRFVRSSSNAMSEALQRSLEAALGIPVIQGYGSTEAGIIAHDSPLPGMRRAGSVGRAVDVEIKIADDDGRALPAGTEGEILVRGPSVMQGYENDEEANRLAFRDGWFRTGDLGHLDAEGYVYVTGRIRERINRGGLKVAPAEVDALFATHAAVRDVATVGVPHPSLGEDVATAIALRPGATVTADELRRYALQHLAAHKVPTSIVFVEEIPRNASGKVRRDALAESLRALPRPHYVAPRDATEALVAQTFAALLGVPRVGAFDNFFELGGDSLRGARAAASIGAQAGVDLEPVALFEAPTVEQFARVVGEARCRAAPHDARAPQLVRRVHRRRTPEPPAPAAPAED